MNSTGHWAHYKITLGSERVLIKAVASCFFFSLLLSWEICWLNRSRKKAWWPCLPGVQASKERCGPVTKLGCACSSLPLQCKVKEVRSQWEPRSRYWKESIENQTEKHPKRWCCSWARRTVLQVGGSAALMSALFMTTVIILITAINNCWALPVKCTLGKRLCMCYLIILTNPIKLEAILGLLLPRTGWTFQNTVMCLRRG